MENPNWVPTRFKTWSKSGNFKVIIVVVVVCVIVIVAVVAKLSFNFNHPNPPVKVYLAASKLHLPI